MSIDRIRSHFTEAATLLERVMGDARTLEAIHDAGQLMVTSLKKGGKLISCGNGGSMCDAMHFAEELTGKFRDERAPIAAVSISDPSHLTCVGNDHGFEQTVETASINPAGLQVFKTASLVFEDAQDCHGGWDFDH